MGQVTQKEASRRLYLSYRQTKRAYQRYLKEGAEGLVHRSRGKASSRAYSIEMKQRVLGLYEEKYWDFGPTLAAEKLLEKDNLQLQLIQMITMEKNRLDKASSQQEESITRVLDVLENELALLIRHKNS